MEGKKNDAVGEVVGEAFVAAKQKEKAVVRRTEFSDDESFKQPLRSLSISEDS